MPSLIQRGKFWYARWQLDGVDHWQSTCKTSKAEALRELHRLVAKARGERRLEDIVRDLDQAIEALPGPERPATRQRVARQLLVGQGKKLLIKDGWAAWIESSNREYDPKPTTLAGYEAIWRRFAAWAEEHRIQFLHLVQPSQAEDYAADLWRSGVSPSTYNAHLKFLRGLFGRLEERGGLAGNAWAKIVTKRKLPGEGRRNLSEAELRTVFAQAAGPLRVLLAIGLYTGLRLIDAVNLRWADIDFQRGLITCVPAKTSRTGKRLEIPAHQALLNLLRMHKASGAQRAAEYVFPKEREAYAADRGALSAEIQAHFQACGIQTTEEPTHAHRRRAVIRVGYHSLRHSFISLASKAGAPPHVIQQLVGHGSPAMTEGYTHLDVEQKREAVAVLPEMVR